MFRPNRIGTPVFHTDTQATSSAALTFGTQAISSTTLPITPVNGTPILDFGETKYNYNGAVTLVPALQKITIVQQFTVSQPLVGDAAGVELNGGGLFVFDKTCLIQPFIVRLTNGATNTLVSGTTTDYPTFIADPILPLEVTAANRFVALRYQTQVVLKRDLGPVGGVYAHGFQISCGTAHTPGGFQAQFSVRQLNDQQSVRYRDTLR